MTADSLLSVSKMMQCFLCTAVGTSGAVSVFDLRAKIDWLGMVIKYVAKGH